MGNNQKMPLKNSWKLFIFSGFDLNYQKKDFTFTIHKFGWDYSRILHSNLRSLQDHNGGHGWKNRNKRRGKVVQVTHLRSEKSSNFPPIQTGLKNTWKQKTAKNILQQQPQKQITEWAASLHQQPCKKAASKKHKKMIDRKKELFTLPKKLNEDTLLKETTHFASLVYCILL